MFQSTRPRRARLLSGNRSAKAEPVSIHAPAKGATTPCACRPRRLRVSIHAPAKGATVFFYLLQHQQLKLRFPRTFADLLRSNKQLIYRIEINYCCQRTYLPCEPPAYSTHSHGSHGSILRDKRPFQINRFLSPHVLNPPSPVGT